jgi:hypothetical protein
MFESRRPGLRRKRKLHSEELHHLFLLPNITSVRAVEKCLQYLEYVAVSLLKILKKTTWYLMA